MRHDSIDPGPVYDDLAAANRELARLRQLAAHDALTGLFNRSRMEEELTERIEAAARTGGPLAVAVLDLDDFRGYNRRHGHRGGDQALRQVATLMQGFQYGADVACRYGGDEFVFIMPATTAVQAAARLDGLRAAVSAAAVHHEGRRLDPITISAGVAEFPADGRTGPALFDAADAALYRAKKQGRDRIEPAGGRLVS